jgi:hypothetical protein
LTAGREWSEGPSPSIEERYSRNRDGARALQAPCRALGEALVPVPRHQRAPGFLRLMSNWARQAGPNPFGLGYVLMNAQRWCAAATCKAMLAPAKVGNRYCHQ